MTVKLLTEQHVEYLSLTGDCTGSSESIHVKMRHCWKSHVHVILFCDIFSITEIKMAKDQSVTEDNDLDVKCGYGKCKPSFLQRLNNPRFMLFTLCFVAISQGKF